MTDRGSETEISQQPSFLKYLLVGEGLLLSDKHKKKLGGDSLREAITIVTDVLENDEQARVKSSWLPCKIDGKDCLLLRKPILINPQEFIVDGEIYCVTMSAKFLLLTSGGCYMNETDFTAYLGVRGVSPVLSPEDTKKVLASLCSPELPDVMRSVKPNENKIDGIGLLRLASSIQAMWEEGSTVEKQSRHGNQMKLNIGTNEKFREFKFEKITDEETKRYLHVLYS